MNKREREILNVLSESPDPMTSTQVCDAKRSFTQSTVIAVLRKLLHMGLIETQGVTHSGKVLTRLFAPTPKAKEAVIAHYLAELEETRGIVTADEIRDAALAAGIAVSKKGQA